jgi:hypothetical protein
LQSLLCSSSQALCAQAHADAGKAGLWCGLQALLVDCSSTIAPCTDDSLKAFGQPSGQKPGCGFPVPKVLALFDAFTGLIIHLLAYPLFTHEQSKVWKLHPLLGAGAVLVADRGFCSFAHLAMIVAAGADAVFRLHHRQIVNFKPYRPVRKKGEKGKPNSRFIKRLGKRDQIVEWIRPRSQPKWMTPEQYAALPPTMLVREVRYTLRNYGQRTLCVTIATTLLNPVKYPKEKIAELYNVRWSVETRFAELKTTLKMRKVKSQTADGVLKELAVYALVFNLVHAVMLEAARKQKVTPDRISFIDAVRWLISADPGEALPALVVNPLRPNRHEPRVIKDLQDTYRKMTKPRNKLRKDLKKQGSRR